MKVYNEIDPLLFNRTLKETMDYMGLQGTELAEETGRSRNNISRIRQGKDSPSIKELVVILNAAEKRKPGFFDEFSRRLSGKARRITVSPEEFVNSLDTSELGALMVAAGVRICGRGEMSDYPLAQHLVS